MSTSSQSVLLNVFFISSTPSSNLMLSLPQNKTIPKVRGILIWSIHLVLCLLLGHFNSIFVCSIFLGIIYAFISTTCPNHLNQLFGKLFFVSSTSSFDLMLAFVTLSSKSSYFIRIPKGREVLYDRGRLLN